MRKSACPLILAALAFTPVLGGAQTAQDTGKQSLTARQIKLRMRAEAATAPYMALIQARSRQYGIDPAFVMSVITVESDGDPNCLSSAGAMGLMQLMPENCTDYGVYQPYDPDQNIRGGVAQLADDVKQFGADVRKVLAAYNAGPRHAKDGSWVNIPETRKYVEVVLGFYEALRPDAGMGYVDPTPAETAVLPPMPTEPGVRYVEGMFQIVQSAQLAVEPAGVAQNAALDDVAQAVLSDLTSGKIAIKDAQVKASRYMAKSRLKTKSLSLTCIETDDILHFEPAWQGQPHRPGGIVGLAHSLFKGKHLWIVVLAEQG